MAVSAKLSALRPDRKFVLADNFRPKTVHEVAKTEGTFRKPTPATRSEQRGRGVTADPDLQRIIKAAMNAFD